jgi:hypothetical protein
MSRLLPVLFILLVSITSAQKGLVVGRITDASNKDVLLGANILVKELDGVGTATDINGRFSLKLPSGVYSIAVSLIGYKSVVKTDIIVRSNSEYFVEVSLSPTSVELNEVTVFADYFDKTINENNLSTLSLAVEEVRRSPGSMGDFQRILQAMPGVSFSSDQTNELLVRGGSPNENLTILDGMELHSTNHYPNQLNSGGPINMINTDLIQDIKFSSGGFIAKYGDKLSAFTNIETREGTRSKYFSGQVDMNMAGIGTVLEGRIGDGKGSWLISARKSYIDLIASSFGLTSTPFYYDGQFKVTYDLNNSHKISWAGIYGHDRIDVVGKSEVEYIEKANQRDSVDYEDIYVYQSQWATGLTLKSLWSKKMYSDITFYANSYKHKFDVKSVFTERQFNSNGNLGSTKDIASRQIFYEESSTTEAALRANFGYVFNNFHKIEFGASLKSASISNDFFLDADTVRYDLNKDGFFSSDFTVDPIIVNPASAFSFNKNLGDENKNYFYLNNSLNFFNERLVLNVGLRYDYFSFSQKGNVSPRISGSLYLQPSITSINFSYGEYYQTQAYPIYWDRFNSGVNQYLENSHATHFIAGIEHILNEGLKLNAEAFYKKYNKLPISERFVNFNDRTFRSEKYLSLGEQKIYGFDFLLQQKFVKDIYATIGYSRMWSQINDLRIGYEGKSYISEYDFPHIFNIVVGKSFNNARSELDKMNFVVKYASMLLPFSDDMEISFRWRYATGSPYTERIFSTSEQHRSGGTSWTNGGWVESDNINGKRYPAYHRLDIGMNSRFNFDWGNLVFVFSIQNVYNHKNIAAYRYNSDGTIDTIYQFSLLPVAGIELEF